MGVTTRWWRRDDTATGVDVWGGPGEVTLAPAPRSALEDTDTDREERERAERERLEREQDEREQRERAEREQREQAERERAERERAERERAERERAEREQAEREQAEREQREREERERAERDRVERLQRERAERERAERERREQQRAEQERRVAARQEHARREREERAERERREQEERERVAPGPRAATSEDTAVIPRVAPEVVDPDRVSTVPGAEAVSPAQAREDAAAREAAARAAAAADRKRRRHRVLMVFLVAVLAVAAVWIIPRLVALAFSLITALGGTTALPAPPVEAPAAAAESPAAAQPRAELPRGGTSIAPDQRVVALRVDPTAPAEESADRLDDLATPFTTPDRPVLPALELPVRDAVDAPAAWQRLAVTRAHRQVLLLTVPVGPVDAGAAVEPWERLLREPDVGLVLDAAGPLPPGAVDATSDRLAAIVRDAALPQKLLVVPAADARSTAPAEVAVVASGPTDAEAPVLRGVVAAPDDPDAREILAAEPSPDVVLLR